MEKDVEDMEDIEIMEDMEGIDIVRDILSVCGTLFGNPRIG